MTLFGKRPSQIFSTPVYDVKGHLAHVHKLHAQYSLNTKAKCDEWTDAVAGAYFEDHPLLPALKKLVTDLFESEDVYALYPPALEDRGFLTRRQAELSEDRIIAATNALAAIFKELRGVLPPFGPSNMTVPLHTVTKEYKEVVAAIRFMAVHCKFGDNLAFPKLAHDMGLTTFRLSGVDPEKPSTRKLLNPLEYDGDPTDFLWGTPFEDFFNAQVPFRIERPRWAEHGALFAKSGHGKTQSLRAIVANFLQEPDPPALFIIDSLGSLIDGIADLEIFSTHLKDRLVILDPSDPANTPAMNFFQLQSDDLCFYLFKAIDQSFTQRQATMIAYLMEYMRNIKDAGLLTLINVCESKANPYPDVVARLSPFARSFFENQFYAKKPDTLVQQTKAQIAARIYTLARMPKFDQIFSSSKGIPFNPFRCMQEKKIVLINTDARPARLGGLDAASGIFGRFILALCLDAARGRPKNERHLALVICDEAKAYMDEHAALILSDARQFGLGLLLATQFPHQLEEGVRREINTNTSVRFMGPVEYSVASQYARDMFTTPEFIMSMKSHDRSHTEWAAYVSNMTDRAVRLDVPFGTLEAMPKLTTTAPMSKETPQPGQPQTQSEKDHAAVDKMIAALDKLEEARAHEGPSKPAPQTAPTPADEPVVKPGKPW